MFFIKTPVIDKMPVPDQLFFALKKAYSGGKILFKKSADEIMME